MKTVMEVCDHIINSEIVRLALVRDDWGMTVEEGYLMLLELLVKSSAGCHVSHTERGFLANFRLRMKSGPPNKAGREFIKLMTYASSNMQSQVCILSNKYRKEPS